MQIRIQDQSETIALILRFCSAVFRIQIHRIRIQALLNANSDPDHGLSRNRCQLSYIHLPLFNNIC
jgi:hypothetical protein